MLRDNAYLHEHEIDFSVQSAERVVPVILKVVGPVQSVVDVGGGTGAWLREFARRGIPSVKLFDSPTVQPHLLVEPTCFEPCDLSRDIPILPKADLVTCLECAEHLPESQANLLVARLTDAADVVIFSAAVPWQGGTEHVNEQPSYYWHGKFSQKGYRCHDVIRGQIIHDSKVAYWYRQNLFVYAREGTRRITEGAAFLPEEFHLVHQSVYERYVGPPGLRTMARHVLPQLLRRISGLYSAAKSSK